MKIRMLQTVEIPYFVYEKDKIYESEIEEHINLYKILVKAGYADEIKEPQNNFKFDYNQINDFIPCKVCTNGNTFGNCQTCKFYRNLQDEDDIESKSIKEINYQIIDLIKSLLKNAT